MKDAKQWYPVSCLLVAVIYTGSKSLQFLSIPVYTYVVFAVHPAQTS